MPQFNRIVNWYIFIEEPVTKKASLSYAEERDVSTIKIGDVEDLIIVTHKANIEAGLRSELTDRIVLCLVSETGIGKTSVIRSAAKRLNANYLHFLLQTRQPEDIGGYPYAVTPENGDPGHLKHLLLEALVKIDPDKDTIILLNELNRANKAMLRAVFQWVGEGRIDDFILPLRCTVIIDMNPPRRGYDTIEFDDAFAARVSEVQLQTDVNHWLAWAARNQVHAAVMSTISKHPQILDQNEEMKSSLTKAANPRSWFKVSNILHSLKGDPIEMAMPLIEGYIGKANGKKVRLAYSASSQSVDGMDVVQKYGEVRERVLEIVDKGQVDKLRDTPDSIIVALNSIALNGMTEEARFLAIDNVSQFYLDLEKDMATRFGRMLTDWIDATPIENKKIWMARLLGNPAVKARVDEMYAWRKEAAAAEPF